MRYTSLLLLLVACEPRESRVNHTWMKQFPISWSFDCAVTEDDRSVVRGSFDYWNTALSQKAFSENGDCNADTVVKVRTDPKPKPDKINTIADTNPILPRPIINLYGIWYGKSDAWRDGVVRHEIGHILGLDHGEYRNCLMYPVQRDDAPGYKVDLACMREIQLIKEAYVQCKCSVR